MKVAIVKPPLIGHLHRGTGVYYQNLKQELLKIDKLNLVEVDIKHLPNKVDLYHFPYFDPFFLTLPFFRNKKTVVTIHDLIPIKFSAHYPVGIKGSIKWWIQKINIHSTDAIITDSHSSKADIKDILNIKSDKVFPIYLAPANIFFQKVDSKIKNKYFIKYHLPEKFALFVGDLNWNKNLFNVVQASLISNLPLVIVSKNINNIKNIEHPWNTTLKLIQPLLKNKSIYTLSNITQEQLVVLYQMAHIFLFPSFYEGFGIPILEAYACGCPVITSDRGSLKEITGAAAEIVIPEEINSISRGIDKIEKDIVYKNQMIDKGYKVVKNFSWKKTAEETHDVYKTVLGV